MNFQLETTFAIRATAAAAELLSPFLDDLDAREAAADTKEGGEVVTEADHLLNAFLISEIRKAFPYDSICAEEGSDHDDPHANRRWFIDPIDGTRSFVRGVPGFSVMLALAVDGEPVVGVCADPLRHEQWYAVRGDGVRKWVREQDQAVVPRGGAARLIWSPYADHDQGAELKRVLGLRSVLEIESFGLRAAEMATEGAGMFASRPMSPNTWDTASAWIMVKEAGGTITDYDGRDLSYSDPAGPNHKRGAVASLGVDHAEVLKHIETHLPAY